MDDWLMSTFDRYEQLLMYELERSSQVLEWSEDGRSVWICGTTRQGSEIIELSLPERLTTSVRGLYACSQRERDFKIVCGAHTLNPIICLKVLAKHQLLASADGEQVELWMKDPRSQDVLRRKQKVVADDSSQPSLLDWVGAAPSWLLIGSPCPTQTVIADLNQNTTVFKAAPCSGQLHATCFSQLPSSTLVFTCTGIKGLVSVWDPRQPPLNPSAQSTFPDSVESSESFAMAVGTSPCIATLSSTNRVCIFDLRALNKLIPVATGKLCGKGDASHHKPCVQLASGSEKLLSVSGVASGVAVHNFSLWSGSVTAPEPFFHHQGHETETSMEVKVLAHCWHPTLPRLLLSTSSDGSLHAWQYCQ